MGVRAGIQLYNARGSCVLDSACGVSRVVGVTALKGADEHGRISIAIPNPGMNRIWTWLLFDGSGFGWYKDEQLNRGRFTRVDTWGNLQGITVTLPYVYKAWVLMNPRAVVYGFY